MKIYVGIYAALLLVGGLIGFQTAGSYPSLIMGTVTALLFAAIAMQQGKGAAWIALIMTGAMFCFFGYRYFLTAKFMPAGLMAILSVGLFVWLISYVRRLREVTDR